MVTAVLVIIFEVWLFAFAGSLPADKLYYAILGALLIVCGRGITGGAPAKNIMADVVNVVLLVCLNVFAFYIARSETADSGIHDAAWHYLTVSVLSFVMACVATMFTFKNINEVVSRRMFFVNSNTSLFSQRLQYSFDRFVAVWAALSYICLITEILNFMIKS